MLAGFILWALKRLLKMAKFSINIPDAYHSALEEWANELGDKKAALAAQLVRVCLESKYPVRFPSSPDSLPGGEPSGPQSPGDEFIADQLRLALNLNNQKMTASTFLEQALKGHLTRWKADYATRLDYRAKKLGLSWEQAYVLLTNRDAPYSQEDLNWAKSQPSIITKAEFLEDIPAREKGKNPAIVESDLQQDNSE